MMQSYPGSKALLLQKKGGDLEVSPFAVPKPQKDEVLVKIHSSALNPVDWIIQKYGIFTDKYPTVPGSDIAGEVVALGEGVSQVAAGDRVFFQGVINEIEHTGFQQYATADVHTLAKIPSNLSYDEASTVPVAHAVAYVGLYSATPHGLGFDAPVKSGGRGKYAGTPLVILGGSSSVGQYVIQLAKLSGFSPIITTSSLKHTDFLKSLGATHVLDRSLPLSKSAVEALTEEPVKVVYDAISIEETQQAGLDVLPSGGQLVLVKVPTAAVTERAPKEDKIVIRALGLKTLPQHVELLREFWAHATSLFESGDLKPNRTEVLPDGLHGIVQGLKKLEENKVSGVKLVSHPQETK